jgi:uncharacterized cofD-like protein
MLVQEVIGALRTSRAMKIYIQNIMTQPGETGGYSAADHIQALAEHSDGILFPNVLLNDELPSAEMLKPYEAEGAALVEIDRDRLKKFGLNIMERQLLSQDGKIRHDPDRLARAVLEMANL